MFFFEKFGFKLDARELREACETSKIQVRKLARALQKDALQVAENFNIPGNLANQIRSQNNVLTFTQDELFWASDFQTFNTDKRMPRKVRMALIDNYNMKFRGGCFAEGVALLPPSP